MKKLLLSFVIFANLYSYELPVIDISTGSKAEIIFFNAQSVLVEEKLSYILKWKTINATQVSITYLGEIALSGEMTITEEEYKMGPITLKAFNVDNDSHDVKIINEYVDADRNAPILDIKVKETNFDDVGTRRYYAPRVWNPRQIH